MGILDKVVKLEKRIEKLTTRGDVPPAPLEIRRAILDDIEEHVQPAGRGRRVFPYDRLIVEVLATPAERAAITAVLDPDEGFAEAVRERLREAGCDRVGRLQVVVKTARKARPDWRAPNFEVGYQRSDSAEASRSEAAAADVRPAAERTAQLVILEGEATRKTYTLSGERVNIGRLSEVSDQERRVVRRNHVVFLEKDADTNQTVSRAHAHLTCSPSGDYRLYDDHSSYGTRVVRDGRMLELPSGSPRGVKLQPGDEIYFGRARAQFVIKE